MQARGLKQLMPSFAREDTVAPHAGAWIETIIEKRAGIISASRLMQARGLKLNFLTLIGMTTMSRLMQARGLKPKSPWKELDSLRRASCRRVD